MTKLNQLAAGPGPAQGNGPLLLGAGVDAAGGKAGGDAEEDEARKRALAAQGAKQPGKKSGPDPEQCTSPGHPVDVVTGAVVDDEVEIALKGPIPVEWARWYSSARNSWKGALGRGGWKHSYEQWLVIEQDCITYVNEDGREIWFSTPSLDAPVFHRSARMTLGSRRQGSYWIEVHDDGLLYEFRTLASGGRAWLVSISDRHGHKLTLDYAVERLQAVHDAVGRELRLAYDDAGRVRRVEVWAAPPQAPGQPHALHQHAQPEAPRLHQWQEYGYHETEELAYSRNALGAEDRFTYDGHHRMVSTTLKNGVSFRYRFDETGRCVKTWGDGGLHEVDLSYDLEARQTTISATHEPRVFTWSPSGLVVGERSPDGKIRRTLAIDGDDYVTSVENAAGERCEITYDERGRRVHERSAAGLEQEWRWQGEVLAGRARPDGHELAYAHDARNELIGIRFPTGAVVELARDAHGRVTEIRCDGALQSSVRYDSHHNVAEEIDGRGGRSLYQHDAVGRLVRWTDPLGNVTTYEYDALGQQTRLSSPDGATTRWEYDALGKPKTVIDAAGGVTRLEWAGVGVVSRVARPDGASLSFEYDSDERLTTIVNARGERYRLEYDTGGRVTRESSFDGRVTEYSYLKSEQVGRVDYPDGLWREFRYDKGGNVVLDRTPHGTIHYEHDAFLRLTKATVDEYGGPIVVELERDEYGRVVRERQGRHVVELELDRWGRRVSRTSAMGKVEHSYDALGDAAGSRLLGRLVSRIERDAAGNELVRSIGERLRVEHRYDAMGRVVEQRALGDGNVRVERRLTYDRLGRPVAQDDGRWGRATYSYDEAGELVDLSQRGYHERFEYDPVGTIVGVVDELNGSRDQRRVRPGGLIVGKSGVRYEHDARGRRVAKTVTRDGRVERTVFVWDARSRLREVRLPSGAIERYAYDAFGRRVRRELVPAASAELTSALKASADGASPPARQITEYVWDVDALCEEHGPRGLRGFVHDPGTLMPAFQVEDGKAYAVMLDYLGTARELLDERGEVAWAARHAAWGRMIEQVGPAGRPTIVCPLRGLGHWADDETGLHYGRFRYWDPDEGCWLSPDPLRALGALQAFGLGGAPTVSVDPFGLDTSSDAAALRKNMVGAGQSTPTFPNEAHHLVASNDPHPDWDAARKNMATHGVGINDPENGMFLASRTKHKPQSGPMKDAIPHSRIHTDAYRDWLASRIAKAGSADEIRGILKEAKSIIRRGDPDGLFASKKRKAELAKKAAAKKSPKTKHGH